MSFNTTTGELVKTIIHDNHLYRVPGCFGISKATAVIDFVFEFTNDCFNEIVSSWKLRTIKAGQWILSLNPLRTIFQLS